MTAEDKTLAVREIKLTLNFVISEAFYDPEKNEEYIKNINAWIERNIMKEFNMGYPSTELNPMFVYVKAEDVTD